MALADFTKQLAQQALLSATSPAKEPAAPAPKEKPKESVCAVILGQINAMQKALKEDEELVVLFENGTEKIRVMEIFVPSWQVAVLKGLDADRNPVRVVSPGERLQLICKVVKAPPGVKPARVGLIAPKP
jgi:hypothetical protein